MKRTPSPRPLLAAAALIAAVVATPACGGDDDDDGGGSAIDGGITPDATVGTPDSIRGHVFVDGDGDGARGDGEVGLQGVAVYLDENENGALDDGEPETTTDSEGRYELAKLAPGAHVVRQVTPFGYRNVSGGEPSASDGAVRSTRSRRPAVGPDRIIGGALADYRDYPFMAAVGSLDEAGHGQF